MWFVVLRKNTAVLNKNGVPGGLWAQIFKVPEGEDLLGFISPIADIKDVYPFKTKKKAEQVAFDFNKDIKWS